MTVRIAYLIVPAWSDQAGQCRIVARTYEREFGNDTPGLREYRANPDLWREVGIMNSRGSIVAFAPSHASHYNHMKSDEPLMAGTVYTFVDGEDAE